MEKFELHPELKDASLEKACKFAERLTREYDPDISVDLHYMLEYLRLNYDLVLRK